MRRLLFLGSVMAVAACQVVVQPVTHRSPAPLAASTAPASARPGGLATAAPTPASTTPPARPMTPSVALVARVRVDPAYIIANHGGSLISNNGGTVLVAGGAIISEHGAGIISEHGGSIVANHAAGRRVLAAGELVPAAGMAVQVRSLRTGAVLPLGLDAQGQPVDITATDANGEAQVFLPEGEAGNVLVEAAVPGSTDQRFRYGLVASTAGGAPAVVDEDSAQATAFLRQAFAGRVAGLMLDDPARALCELGGSDAYSPAVTAVLKETVREVYEAAQRAGVREGTGATALAKTIGDGLLANVDLGAIQITPATYVGYTKQEPAVAAIVDVMRLLRDQAGKRLAANPRYFDDAPYFREGNSCKPGTYAVSRPADLNSFLVEEYLSLSSTKALTRLRLVMEDLDARQVPGLAEDQGTRMSAAASAVESALALAFVTDQVGAKTRTLAQIIAYDPNRPAPAGVKPPKPCWREAEGPFTGCSASPSANTGR